MDYAESGRRAAAKRYFRPRRWGFFLILSLFFAFLLLPGGWAMLDASYYLGAGSAFAGLFTIALCLGLICLFYGMFIGFGIVPKDEFIDKLKQDDISRLKIVSRAMSLSNLPTSIRKPVFVVFEEPISAPSGDKQELQRRMSDAMRISHGLRWGDDLVVRFTPVAMAVFMFGEEQLAIYSAHLDLTTGNLVDEQLSEVSYQDIVNFSCDNYSDRLSYSFFWLRVLLTWINPLNWLALLRPASARVGALSGPDQIRVMQRLRDRFGPTIIDDVLQLNLQRRYVISLTSGEAFKFAFNDLRPVSTSNLAADDRHYAEGPSGLETARQIVREKKLALLQQEQSVSVAGTTLV